MRKGKKFERDVAKLLGRTICGDPRAFMRMPLQGRSLEKFEGDIIPNPLPTIPEATRRLSGSFMRKFMIDAKDRKGWEFDTLVLSEDCAVWKWWAKLEKSALDMAKEPLMILKYRHKVWALMRSAESSNWISPRRRLYVTDLKHSLILFPWDEMKEFDKTKLEVYNNETHGNPGTAKPVGETPPFGR